MINCAIAGLGRIGSTLENDSKREKPASHAGAISLHPETHLIAGCDISQDKCELFKGRWNCNNIYTDFHKMIKNHNIDILHIATPPETHLEMITKALQYKIPVIILEKPIADNITDAVTIAEICQKSSSKILINHERRYSLQYRRVKDMIREKYYGELLSINAKLYMARNRKISKMLYDDGTHMIDLINFICDKDPLLLNAHGNTNTVFCSMQSNEIMINFEAGRMRDHVVFELDFSFEKGRIIAGNGIYSEYESRESPFYENFRSLIKNDITINKTEYFKGMFEDAVLCFKGKERIPVSGISDGLNTINLIEEIIEKANLER